MKTPVTVLLLAAICCAPSVGFSAAPTWWTTRGVLNPSATPNDYAAANIGQVKHIAKQAFLEMEATLPGGAGAPISQLITSWSQPPAPGVTRNDYAAVNQGQLKTIAKLYYDRLAQFDYDGPPLSGGNPYPWTATATDDINYAAANIGQVKYVFSFDLSAVIDPNDLDGDGMPNDWEIYHGLNPNIADGHLDTDNDGRSNLDEFTAKTNPKNGADQAVTNTTGHDVVITLVGPHYYGVNKSSGVITAVPSL